MADYYSLFVFRSRFNVNLVESSPGKTWRIAPPEEASTPFFLNPWRSFFKNTPFSESMGHAYYWKTALFSMEMRTSMASTFEINCRDRGVYIIVLPDQQNNCTRQLPMGAGHCPWGGYTDWIVCNIHGEEHLASRCRAMLRPGTFGKFGILPATLETCQYWETFPDRATCPFATFGKFGILPATLATC